MEANRFNQGFYNFDPGGFALSRILALLCLFLSFLFPTVLQPLKIVIVGVLFFLVFLWVSRTGFLKFWSSGLIVFVVAFSFLGSAWSVFGLVEGNPGAKSVLNVMVFYPVIFLFFSAIFVPGDANKIEKFFLFSCLFLIFYQISYLMSAAGFDGGKFYSLNGALFGSTVGGFQKDSFFSFSLPSVASLIFFMPFFAVNLLFSKKFSVLSLVVVSLMIFLAFASGRRGLYVSFAASLFFSFFIGLFSGVVKFNSFFFRFFVLFVSFFMLMVFLFSNGFLDVEVIYDDISSISNFSDNESNLERKYQFDALYSGFVSAPFFGNGAGAVAEYIRSIEQPWAYELFYMAIMFQYGLFGFFVYSIGVVFLLLMLLKIVFDSSIPDSSRFSVLKIFSGFVSFLLASGTNPYLAKFDYMWVVFIPVAIVNCYLVHRKV